MTQIESTSDSITAGAFSSEILAPSIGQRRRQSLSDPKGCIVVVDDEPVILNLMSTFLQPHGIEVHIFTNPFDAIRWFELHWSTVDLIFLDMKNPQMDGEYCFALLQSIDSDARIALMSGGADSVTIQELLGEGALRFFPKPFDFSAVTKWALYEGMGRH